MKLHFTLIIGLFFIGCTDNHRTDRQVDVTQERLTTSPTSQEQPQINLTVFETPLIMFNKPYQLRIDPELNNNQLASTILLTSANDTIFSKTITIDTFYDNLKNNPFLKDSVDLSNFQLDYSMTRTTLHGIRNENLYFESTLESNSGDPTRYILFQIEYLSYVGRLSINGIGHRTESWGRNRGDAITEKNKIEKKAP